MPVNRRTLLQLVGGVTAFSTTSLAGCTGNSDGGLGSGSGRTGGGHSAYRPWLWTKEKQGGSRLRFGYVKWETLRKLDVATSSENSDEKSLENVDDPLLLGAVGGLGVVVAGLGIRLLVIGLGGLFTPEEKSGGGTADNSSSDSKTAADYDTSISEIISVNEQYVLLGNIDTDEISRAASKAGLNEQEAVAEYTVYTPKEPGEQSTGSTIQGVAFNSDTIILFDPSKPETLETLVATKAGDRTRPSRADSNLEWLLNTAGGGDIVLGGYGQGQTPLKQGAESEFGALNIENTVGGVFSMTFDGTTGTSGSMAYQFDTPVDQIDEEEIDEIKQTAGSTAAEQSVETDGKRLVATATWNGNALEEASERSG